jgi:hypothetical protein
VSLDKIECLKLCKYAEVVAIGKPIRCKYKGNPFRSCPNDSGTDEKNNNKCYEYSLKEGD